MKRILFLSILLPFWGHGQNSCADAVAITTGTYTTGTINGTNVSGSTVCWGTTSQLGAHAEWYSYTPAADGMATIETNLPANDGIALSNNIKLNVHIGECGALECHGTDGLIFGSGPYHAKVTFEARVGRTYFISFDDYYSNKGVQFTLTLQTPACSNTVPFTENWLTHLDFTCWKPYGGNTFQSWKYHNAMNLDSDPQRDPVVVSYPAPDASAPKNEWLVSPILNLEGGTNYAISIKYNALHFGGTGAQPNESLRTVILSQQDPALADETVLGQVDGITQQGAYTPPYNSELASTVTYNFTPATTGSYYLGLHSVSPATTGALVVYEVKVATQPLGTAKFNKGGFTVFPNPAVDKLSIESDGHTPAEIIEVLDVNGKLVKRLEVAGEKISVIDISTMSRGMYVLKIISGKDITVKKIIKS